MSVAVAPAPALPSHDVIPSVSLDARLVGLAGIGRMIEGLWRGLVDIGVDVSGLWAPSARDWRGELRGEPPGRHIQLAARPFSPTEQLVLPRVLRRLGVSAHHAPGWAVPYLSGVPLVLTVHDLYPYLEPWIARSPLAAAVYRTVVPRAVRRAQRVVAVSPFTARQLADTFGVEPERLRVIEHGIDHERWRPGSPETIARVRLRHGVPSEYLLYSGSAKPHKNLKMLLGAHRPEHPPLVLAGPTPAELPRPHSGDDKTVIALGRVSDEDLAALYSGALALVLPSLCESVGLPALEALACGTPVVCSDRGGLPDTVRDAGFTLPATDSEAWTDGLTRISQDESLRARLVAAGEQLVRRRTWQDAARSYAEVYREAAG